ncbi:Hypothetical protein CINCED_3A007722 [Cinara cedri]|uniref:Uncharacterized protein n=1 Tax=Cinara cedri TaxID=506608 RepID=A0A5E4NR06_9HEMI|nr:Hypothetical protein CINCED_3A007722 [Cinara cedri]
MYDDENDGGPRTVRHHGKHHKMAPPNRWPGAADGLPGGGDMIVHHHGRHEMLADNLNDTSAGTPPPPHVLHATSVSMCYTTNEVLVIIAVTCFLNFAFILLIMTCVHCFTDPSHHKKFGAVAYAELGDELFDGDMVDADTVTLLNPTKPPPGQDDDCGLPPYDRKIAAEYDAESCASYQSLVRHEHRYKSNRRSEEELFLFE